jgi:hypothetical protein
VKNDSCGKEIKLNSVKANNCQLLHVCFYVF